MLWANKGDVSKPWKTWQRNRKEQNPESQQENWERRERNHRMVWVEGTLKFSAVGRDKFGLSGVCPRHETILGKKNQNNIESFFRENDFCYTLKRYKSMKMHIIITDTHAVSKYLLQKCYLNGLFFLQWALYWWKLEHESGETCERKKKMQCIYPIYLKPANDSGWCSLRCSW